MFEALLLLFIKHFICDFPLQKYAWLYSNKGTYCHPGGIVHAGIHGLFTWLIFVYFGVEYAYAFALTDFLLHYHIDWAKMKLNNHLNLKPDNSEWFWILLGFDQLLHHLTYFGMVYFAFLYKA